MLLVPDGNGPFPAIFVPFYEPETSTGQNQSKLRDFAYQLTKRGFVTLSIGSPGGDARTPDTAGVPIQPLCFLGYVAANGYQALTSLHRGIARFPGAYRLQESFDSVADRLLKHEWQMALAIGKIGRYGEAQSRMKEACEFVSSKMKAAERLPHKPIRSVAIVGNLEFPQCYFYRIEQKVEHLDELLMGDLGRGPAGEI